MTRGKNCCSDPVKVQTSGRLKCCGETLREKHCKEEWDRIPPNQCERQKTITTRLQLKVVLQATESLGVLSFLQHRIL